MSAAELAGGTGNTMSGSAQYVVQGRDIAVTFAAAQAPRATPSLAPVPPSSFIDRIHEKRVMHDCGGQRNENGRPPVIVLRGMVGVGKTALLRQAIAEMADSFPDGVLYANCGPTGDSPSEIVGRFLLALRVPEACIPASYAARVDMYRSLTAGLRLIVAFDDVTDAAQVTALLPNSAQSIVLAAGNRVLEELHLDGAVDIELRRLAREYGMELLVEICGQERIFAEPEAARALVELCDGLPLVLRLAAARLAVRPQWTVQRLADELAESPMSEKVSAMFDLVYRDLPERLASLYRLLGVLVGGRFGAEVIAAMSGETVARTRKDLDEFCQSALVEERADGTYGLHRMVRLHAIERSEAEDTVDTRRDWLRRAVEWWTFGAVAADVALTGLPRLRTEDPRVVLGEAEVKLSKSAALAWYDTEHTNLLSALLACADAGWDEHVCRLFEAMFPYYDLRKMLAAWKQAGELAVNAAARCGNSAAEARCRCLLAKVLQELEDYPAAHQHLDRARELADAGQLRASTADFTGNVYLREGEYAIALEWFEKSRALHEELGLVRGTALQTQFVGRALGKLGRVDEALTTLHKARELAESTDAELLLPKILLSTGRVLAEAERDVDAAGVLEEALLLGKENAKVQADALVLLADIARRRGNTVAADEFRTRAVAVYEKMGSPRAARLLAGLEV